MSYILKTQEPVWLPDIARPRAAFDRTETDEGAIHTRAMARLWAAAWFGSDPVRQTGTWRTKSSR